MKKDGWKKVFLNKNIITILFFLNTLSLSLHTHTHTHTHTHYEYTFLPILSIYIQQHVLATSFASTFSRCLNFLHRTQTYICHQHRMLWLAWCWVCLVGLWCRSRSGVRCVSAAWRSDWQRPRVRPGYSFQAPDSQTWRVIKTIFNHTIIKNSSPEESLSLTNGATAERVQSVIDHRKHPDVHLYCCSPARDSVYSVAVNAPKYVGLRKPKFYLNVLVIIFS